MNLRRGQSILEYVILMVIVIAALITMQVYMKRGIQGRWKAAVDDLGDPYDPKTTNFSLSYNYDTNSSSEVKVVNDQGNWTTARYDATNSTEQKTGVWTTPTK